MIGLIIEKDKVINFMPMNNLIYAFILFTIGQAIIWIQSNGQFLWPWWKNNPLLVSFTLGGFASYIFIKATYYTYTFFGNQLWPGRFIGFASGIIVFALLTWLLMNESINEKTLVSLFLATALLAVQIFWK
jgi:hypothetical protein